MINIDLRTADSDAVFAAIKAGEITIKDFDFWLSCREEDAYDLGHDRGYEKGIGWGGC